MLLGLRIRNIENFQDKVVGISFRRRDQLQPEVVCGVLGNVVQSNARFGMSDRLEVYLHHAGNGGMAEKTKGRSLNVVSAIKRALLLLWQHSCVWLMH